MSQQPPTPDRAPGPSLQTRRTRFAAAFVGWRERIVEALLLAAALFSIAITGGIVAILVTQSARFFVSGGEEKYVYFENLPADAYAEDGQSLAISLPGKFYLFEGIPAGAYSAGEGGRLRIAFRGKEVEIPVSSDEQRGQILEEKPTSGEVRGDELHLHRRGADFVLPLTAEQREHLTTGRTVVLSATDERRQQILAAGPKTARVWGASLLLSGGDSEKEFSLAIDEHQKAELTRGRGDTAAAVGEFLTSTEWAPQSSEPHFGILPLICGTLVTTGVALLVALPLGTTVAIYLSEYAPFLLREILKPVLELLSAVPTVVYGYFAMLFVTPLLRQALLPLGIDLGVYNMLSAGVVMGIMIIPYVSSLSEDAMRAVPSLLREGSYALGANKFTTATRVVFPAALSGIGSAYILGISRAIGETMIVAIAAGQQPTVTLNPTRPGETITAYIVRISQGDLAHGGIGYESIFAAGMALFVMTLVFNVAGWVLRKASGRRTNVDPNIARVIAVRKRQDMIFNAFGVACTLVGIVTLAAVLLIDLLVDSVGLLGQYSKDVIDARQADIQVVRTKREGKTAYQMKLTLPDGELTLPIESRHARIIDAEEPYGPVRLEGDRLRIVFGEPDPEGMVLQQTIVLPLDSATVARLTAGDSKWTKAAQVVPRFLFGRPSSEPNEAGILTPLVGSMLVILVTIATAVPLGVAAGVYLEEYAAKNWLTTLIEINISNLASVPSILYGLMALGVLVFWMGRNIMAAGLTLAFLILPIVIVATREALRAIPQSIREAALALGATRWQVVWHHLLPYSTGGIATGVIIGVSRALGETAPLVTIGAVTFITRLPPAPVSVSPPSFNPLGWLWSDFTVMPIQMFYWVSEPDPAFRTNAAAAGVVLIAFTLSLNAVAIYLRYRLRRSIKW